jgi:hypothetical protein
MLTVLANLLFAASHHSILSSSSRPQRSFGHFQRAKCHHQDLSALVLSLSQSFESRDDIASDLPITHQERFSRFHTSTYHAPHIERILLLSDLHCDYATNREWLQNICSKPSNDLSKTMILVAGDVSHNLEILQWTFRTLKDAFGEVTFVPGNHDIWLDKPRKHKPVATKLDSDDDALSNVDLKLSGTGDGCTNSVEKLEKLFELCVEEDVRIGPVKIENEQSDLWIIPLLSWYHPSFDTEPPIQGWGGIPSARKVVADYRKAKWPEPLSLLDDSIALFMDELNDIIFNFDSDIPDKSTTIITYSHFLPRVDLLPEKRYLSLPTLHSCVGSTFLESRLRNLNSHFGGLKDIEHLHAFGHSHLSWDQNIDKVRYIHVPLAYPREWEQRRRSLEIGTMQGEVSDNRFPVCIWEKDAQSNDLKDGFPHEWLGGWWSKYYSIMKRQPHRNTELAPWVARRFRQLPGGFIEDFDHIKVEMEHKLHHPRILKTGTGPWYNVTK